MSSTGDKVLNAIITGLALAAFAVESIAKVEGSGGNLRLELILASSFQATAFLYFAKSIVFQDRNESQLGYIADQVQGTFYLLISFPLLSWALIQNYPDLQFFEDQSNLGFFDLFLFVIDQVMAGTLLLDIVELYKLTPIVMSSSNLFFVLYANFLNFIIFLIIISNVVYFARRR